MANLLFQKGFSQGLRKRQWCSNIFNKNWFSSAFWIYTERSGSTEAGLRGNLGRCTSVWWGCQRPIQNGGMQSLPSNYQRTVWSLSVLYSRGQQTAPHVQVETELFVCDAMEGKLCQYFNCWNSAICLLNLFPSSLFLCIKRAWTLYFFETLCFVISYSPACQCFIQTYHVYSQFSRMLV